MVSVCHVSWADGADRYGDDSRFGAASFAPQIREMIDRLLATSGEGNPFHSFVEVIRAAHSLEADLELDALVPAFATETARDQWGDLCAFWRQGANAGAAAAIRIIAERLSQYGTLVRWDGEA